MRRAALVGLVALVPLVAACSSGASGAAPTTSAPTGGDGSALVAPQGFGTVTVVVTLPDGSTREWCLWLADTPALRARGLMGVSDPGLGGRAGMAFVFEQDTSSGFWMKNTLQPLSIAWYGDDGGFVSSTDMEPCPADAATCPSYLPDGSYRTAVEVPLGDLDQLGLVDGSRIALAGSCGAGVAA